MTDTQDIIESDALESVPPKKPSGRPKNTKYLPFNEAQDIVRAELISSKGQYEQWHARNHITTIPKFPYRVYTKPGEWLSWNSWLGNDNKFSQRQSTNWRTFKEAKTYAHSLQLKSSIEWIEHCRLDTFPDDLPKHPEITYPDWISWPNFLGNTPTERIEAIKEAQKTQVYYIVHEVGVPENVLTFGIEPMGIAGMKDRYNRGNIHMVKMFWHDIEKASIIKQVVDSLSSPYMGMNNQRIVPNVYQIIEIIQYHLDSIR